MEPRPGPKTTEFWITILTSVGAVLVAIGFDVDVEEMAAVVAPAIAYILSRGWAKSNTPPQPPV